MHRTNLAPTRNKRTRGQGQTADFPRLLGGQLCLHFANTIESPLSNNPVEFLAMYADLVNWCRHAGAIEPEEGGLLAAGQARTADGEAIFKRAVALREALTGVFRSVARHRAPDDADLAIVTREYAEALTNARLTARESGYAWSWDHAPNDLRQPLWLVAESAARLLVEGDLSRIKECPGAGDCGWLFYDQSKNGRRRWCSMEGCGSRVKMRNQYARQHSHQA